MTIWLTFNRKFDYLNLRIWIKASSNLVRHLLSHSSNLNNNPKPGLAFPLPTNPYKPGLRLYNQPTQMEKNDWHSTSSLNKIWSILHTSCLSPTVASKFRLNSTSATASQPCRIFSKLMLLGTCMLPSWCFSLSIVLSKVPRSATQLIRLLKGLIWVCRYFSLFHFWLNSLNSKTKKCSGSSWTSLLTCLRIWLLASVSTQSQSGTLKLSRCSGSW